MDRFDRLEELKDILKEVPLFRDLSVKQRYVLAEHGWEHTYPEGRALCQEGKRGDNFFVILDGSAIASRRGRKIGTLGRGDYFGEIALLDNAERTATVTAASPLHCFVLGRSDFKAVIYIEGIAVKLLHTMAARLRAGDKLEAD